MAFPRILALAGLLALAACAQPAQPVAMDQDMKMGPFTLRAVEARAYSRAHQGVPWEVEVVFTLDGGNRFEREDFLETVSRRSKVYLTTAGGKPERVWLLAHSEDRRSVYLQGNPPLGSKGYAVEIGNPYGKPAAYRLDLGI